MSNGHHKSDCKLGAVRVTKMKNTRPYTLRTMMVERNKVTIIQGKENKLLYKCVRTK